MLASEERRSSLKNTIPKTKRNILSGLGKGKELNIDQSKPEIRLISSRHIINSKRRALILSKELEDEQEYKKNYTFHPNIYSTNAQSKYLDISIKESVSNDNLECSFKPGISSNSKAYAKEYAFLNIIERLTQKQIPEAIPNKSSMTVKIDPKEFLKRQIAHEIHRRQRLDYLATVTEKHSPEISIKSKMLAAKKGDAKERILKPKKDIEVNEMSDWFKPIINPNSVSILEESTRVNKKATSVKAEKCINSNDKVSSKQYSRKGKLTTKTTPQKSKGAQRKIRKEIEEESECTHKPKLNPFPKYLKDDSKLNTTAYEKKEYKYSKRKKDLELV